MKKLPWILIVLLALSSCRTHTVYVPIETKVVDSIVYHDTTFQEKLIPYRDSVSILDTSSFLKNPYSYSYARYSNGMLYHSLGIYPFATVTVKVPYFLERIIRIETPKPYEVERKLSWWERIRLDLGGYAIAIVIIEILVVVGRCVYKLKKGG